MLHTRKAQTEADAEQMALRNACRAEIVKRAMGSKYGCHPANHVPKSTEAAQVVQLVAHTHASR